VHSSLTEGSLSGCLELFVLFLKFVKTTILVSFPVYDFSLHLPQTKYMVNKLHHVSAILIRE